MLVRSIDCHLLLGCVAESDPDALVRSPPILVDKVPKHPIVGLGRAAGPQPPRPQVPMENGIELHPIEGDLGQEEQERHQTDDDPELSVRCRAVADLMLDQTRAQGDEERESGGGDGAAGHQDADGNGRWSKSSERGHVEDPICQHHADQEQSAEQDRASATGGQGGQSGIADES